MKYQIEIKETYKRLVEVKATNRADAERQVKEQYQNGEIVLDKNDLVDSDVNYFNKIVDRDRPNVTEEFYLKNSSQPQLAEIFMSQWDDVGSRFESLKNILLEHEFIASDDFYHDFCASFITKIKEPLLESLKSDDININNEYFELNLDHFEHLLNEYEMSEQRIHNKEGGAGEYDRNLHFCYELQRYGDTILTSLRKDFLEVEQKMALNLEADNEITDEFEEELER